MRLAKLMPAADSGGYHHKTEYFDTPQRRDARPRSIVARFSRYNDREAVMSARKLKGTNIYLNDDLCAASQAIKNTQMPELKQARARGKIAYFRHTKLIIKEATDRRSVQPRENKSGQRTADANNGVGAAVTAGTSGESVAAAFPPLSQPGAARSQEEHALSLSEAKDTGTR